MSLFGAAAGVKTVVVAPRVNGKRESGPGLPHRARVNARPVIPAFALAGGHQLVNMGRHF